MIRLHELTIRNGGFTLDRVTLEIPTGAYAVLMGPTGCGKTTVIEAICGLKRVTAGRIELHGRDVTALRPSERGVGLVPQDGALFSTMTVRENLGFALHIRRTPQADIDRRVDELAELLDIRPLLPRETAGLSGGEAQRVALGRALAAQPQTLCLDEPLNALDATTRDTMIRLLRDVQRQTGVTALHVTHDPAEAQRLGDVLLRFDNGTIRQ